MDQTSAPTTLTEIAVASGAGDNLRVYSAVDALGRTVQRFDRVDGWSAQAKQLCEAMHRVISTMHGLSPQEFDIRPQSWIEPADDAPGAFRTGWALLLRSRPECAELVDQCRADAQRIATLLQRPTNQMRRANPAGSALVSDAAESHITLEHLANEPLLGARLKTAVDVHVAGHPVLRLMGVLRRRANRGFSSQTLSIAGGRLTEAKLAGRTRHVSVIGTNKSTGESFRQDRVRFEDRWRRQIAAAIEQPSARITMEIVCETVDTGRAKPRRHYKLVDLNVPDRLATDV
jgi:hypothetical protein